MDHEIRDAREEDGAAMVALLPRLASFGAPPEAVLSFSFWSDALGGDPAVVGSTLRLNGTVATVVGVAPQGFSGHFIGFPSDLWLPITAAVISYEGRQMSFTPGVFIGKANTTAKSLAIIGKP